MAIVSALILFDIDGTLLRRSGPAHRAALEEALFRVARVETSTNHIPVQGMLDGEILRWMMRDGGIPAREQERLIGPVMQSAQTIYARTCPDLRRKVCPGVRPLLRKLDRLGVPMGLVTGNLSRIAWKKMERASLKEHFRFGAFAEEGRTRAQLARSAVREAKTRGWIQGRSPVALIGDHPNDIAAARANGIRAIAVGTGVVGMEELAAQRPDVLVPDLRELKLESLWS
jgi:phosphoglycolate phosphatase-like HAD superfamily hydrolase